ncbi:MAG: DUF4296 domain-containing protein [Prevotella sp.]|nr:DUF4296 domain-containing protein [Prevotella sp.]
MLHVAHYASRWSICLVLAICFACKPSVPGKYIQQGKMEDILYDYHIADAMALSEAQSAEWNYKKAFYRQAVLNKYGVTQEELDSSLAYYFRDTERLKSIYTNVSKRLSEEALALGASANDINLYSSDGIQGDTASVWVGGRTTILLPKTPDNLVSFAVKADTAFHKGDKLMLNFDTQYIIQDGARDATAMLAIRFDNDSVAKQMVHLSSNTNYSLQLTDDKHIGIKEVRGFITLPAPSVSTSTMKLICLHNLKLVRMHEIVKDEKTNSDTTDDSEPSDNPGTSGNSESSVNSGLPVKTRGDSTARMPVKAIGQPKDLPSAKTGKIGR